MSGWLRLSEPSCQRTNVRAGPGEAVDAARHLSRALRRKTTPRDRRGDREGHTRIQARDERFERQPPITRETSRHGAERRVGTQAIAWNGIDRNRVRAGTE